MIQQLPYMIPIYKSNHRRIQGRQLWLLLEGRLDKVCQQLLDGCVANGHPFWIKRMHSTQNSTCNKSLSAYASKNDKQILTSSRMLRSAKDTSDLCYCDARSHSLDLEALNQGETMTFAVHWSIILSEELYVASLVVCAQLPKGQKLLPAMSKSTWGDEGRLLLAIAACRMLACSTVGPSIIVCRISWG